MNRYFYPLSFAFALGIVWPFAVWTLHIPAYILPSPPALFTDLFAHAPYYLIHAGTTFTEALLGFAAATGAGLALGALFSVYRDARYTLLPYVTALQTVPIVAVAPLLILWLGNGLTSRVAMAMLICFFPVVVNATKGFMSVSREQLSLASLYGASLWHVFWKFRVPNSVPLCVAGIKTAAPLSMIGAIVAEYAGSDQGLGYVLIQATYRLDSVQLFVSIAFAAVGGLLLSGIVSLVEYNALKKYSY